MKQTEIILKKVEASEGYVLTNGETFGNPIFLGANDSIENWYEITIEEAEAIQKAELDEEIQE